MALRAPGRGLLRPRVQLGTQVQAQAEAGWQLPVAPRLPEAKVAAA